MCLISTWIFAQQRILKGTVKDATTGENLVGATIQIQTTTKGTETDSNGNYQIEISNGTQTVVFSSIGYQTITKNIQISKDVTVLNIGLTTETTQLSELKINSKQNKTLGAQIVQKGVLKLRPINNAQDILKVVPGLFIAQHAGGGKAEQIFLRGFDNDHGTDFAAFIDNIPVNMSSHAHGQGYADMHFIIPETIGNIDYFKGPHEASLGNFATSGAAKLKTKSRLGRNVIKAEYGAYNYARGLAMITLLDNKNFLSKNYENAYVAIEGTYNEGFFDSKMNLRRLNGFAKYSLEINNKNFLEVSGSGFTSKWNASGQIPYRAVQSGMIGYFGAIDDTEGGNTDRYHVNALLNSEINENNTFTNSLFFVANSYDLYSNFTLFQENEVDGDMIYQHENRKVFGYNGNWENKSFLANKPLTSEIGAFIRADFNKMGLDNAVKRQITSSVNHYDLQEVNYALYLKETLELTSKLTFVAGLRGDFFTFQQEDLLNNTGTEKENAFRFSPKFSSYYQVTPSVQLFGKASIGYHSNYTQTAISRPDIHPLPKVEGYDLGTAFKIGEKFVGNFTAWYLKSDAEYVFVADAGGFENNGKSERLGVEASFKYQPLPFLWLEADGNYSHGKLLDSPSGENSIPAAPRFTSTGGAVFKFKNGINGSLRYRYLGQRPLVEDESVEAEAYFLVDAVLNYTKPKYEIGITVENIFDERWMEAVFYDSSKLKNETEPQDDFHFTPGTPFFIKAGITYFF